MPSVKTLEKRHGKERESPRVPVMLSNGKKIELLPGRQNALVRRVLDDFCALFASAGRVLCVRDRGGEWSYLDPGALMELGLVRKKNSNLPDIVVHHPEKNRLFLIDAENIRGPISPERWHELRELFAGSKAHKIYVSAFRTRRALKDHIEDISMEAVAWISKSPTHLIHFNGDRLVGPYDD